MSTVTLNHGAISRFFQNRVGVGGVGNAGMRTEAVRLAEAMAREARRSARSGELFRRRTGEVADSVHAIVRTSAKSGVTEVGVGTTSKVGGYLEKGTEPHIISARPGALATAFLRSAPGHPDPLINFNITHVNHPGNRAYRWLRKAVDDVLARRL